MANYKQSSIAGESWQRANRVVIENPFNSTPSICFVEQQIINIGTDNIVKDVGNINEPFTPENALTEFPLLHPETGAQIGTAKYQDVYVMLSSLYMALATRRDGV